MCTLGLGGDGERPGPREPEVMFGMQGGPVLLRGCWALFSLYEASGLLPALLSAWPPQGQAKDEEEMWS